MPDFYFQFPGSDKLSHMHCGGTYKPGDPPPSGYLDWHEWAEVQHKAGLKQDTCPQCGKWHFPQELSDQTVTSVGNTRKDGTGQTITITKRLCLKCADPLPGEQEVKGRGE